MVEPQEIKLGIPCLLRLQHNFKLSPLLAHKVGGALNNGMRLGGRRLKCKEPEGERGKNSDK